MIFPCVNKSSILFWYNIVLTQNSQYFQLLGACLPWEMFLIFYFCFISSNAVNLAELKVFCLLCRSKYLSHLAFLDWKLELQIQKLRRHTGDSQFNTILIKIQIQVEVLVLQLISVLLVWFDLASTLSFSKSSVFTTKYLLFSRGAQIFCGVHI